MATMSTRAFQDLALRLAAPAADVANYCDHVDHNEVTDRAWVAEAGHTLIREACAFADGQGLWIVELYAERLGAIEARNVLAHPGAYDGHSTVLGARSWRDLQLIQVEHDRYYHPDVAGLSKAGQLQHYALHLAKLVGAFAVAADADDLLQRRLPDVLLFGIKLLTVMGVRLADEALPRLAAGSDAAARA